MAGLFDFIGDEERQMALAAGLLSGGWAGGSKGLLDSMRAERERNSPEAKLRLGLLSAQTDETRAQGDERRAKAAKETALLDLERRRREALPGLFQSAPQMGQLGSGSMGAMPAPGGQIMPQSGQLNWQAALAAGYKPEEIQQLAGLSNIGRQEVARTIETTDAQGRPVTVQIDKFGQPVGQGMGKFLPPIMQGLGNRTAAIDPVTLQERGSFAQGQSPDSVASNAITMRGQNMADARSREANANGAIPSGYRRSLNGGLEFIPGGPADPNAARRAAPTEDERKAAGWLSQAAKGYADMQNAVTIDPKANRPGVIESLPFVPENTANMTRSPARQQFNQGASALSEAVLRAATGAGVNKDEALQKIRELTPQWGDSPDVITQKEASARNYLEALAVRSGRANPGGSPQPQPTMRFNPQTGQVEMVR